MLNLIFILVKGNRTDPNTLQIHKDTTCYFCCKKEGSYLPCLQWPSYTSLSTTSLWKSLQRFSFSVQEDLGSLQFEFPPEQRHRSVPLLLCQVCHYWRKVVLSLPLLWCSLLGTRPFTPHPAFIKLWLTHSCGLPLSMSLEVLVECDNTLKYQAH